MNTDPLAPLAGGTYRIQVVQPTNPFGAGHELLLILLALNVLLLGALVVSQITFVRGRRAGAMAWFNRHNWRRTLTETLLVAIGLYFLWSIRGLLPPFLVAFFLASLLDPVVTNQQRHGRPRGWTVATIFTLAFLCIALAAVLVVRLVGPQMQDLIAHGPEKTAQVNKWADNFYTAHKTQLSYVGIDKPFTDKTGPVITTATSILNNLKTSLAGFAGEVLWLIIIPLSLFYFLLDYQALRAKLIAFFPSRYQSNVDKMSLEIVDIFGRYVRGLAKACALYAIAMTVLFQIFRLDYFLFLGIAAGVLYAVPYVGPAIAMGTAGIIALTMDRGPVGVALVIACFVAIHVTFDNVITPRVVGGSVGLHPLLNVFAITVGATLFGVWGMLLAVPVAASIQMLLIYFFPKLAEKPTISPMPAQTPTPDERIWDESAAAVD